MKEQECGSRILPGVADGQPAPPGDKEYLVVFHLVPGAVDIIMATPFCRYQQADIGGMLRAFIWALKLFEEQDMIGINRRGYFIVTVEGFRQWLNEHCKTC